jgi:small-conductance mechanosensitive channel
VGLGCAGVGRHSGPTRIAAQDADRGKSFISNIVAACISVCSALAILGFVFELPLQGIVATSVLLRSCWGLLLSCTNWSANPGSEHPRRCFSGLSLSVEKPYGVGDAILLEGGVEGNVVQINWRSTHLRNSERTIS